MKLRIIIFQHINQNFGFILKMKGKNIFNQKKKIYIYIFKIFSTYFSLLWKTAHFRPSESLRGKNYILGVSKTISLI